MIELAIVTGPETLISEPIVAAAAVEELEANTTGFTNEVLPVMKVSPPTDTVLPATRSDDVETLPAAVIGPQIDAENPAVIPLLTDKFDPTATEPRVVAVVPNTADPDVEAVEPILQRPPTETLPHESISPPTNNRSVTENDFPAITEEQTDNVVRESTIEH